MSITFIVDESGLDELGRLLKGPRQSTRHDIWLWLYLEYYENADLDPSTCNGSTMRDTIATAVKGNTHILEAINSDKDRALLPDGNFKWIDGDERQYQWLLRRIEGITALALPKGLVHLTGRNHLIAMLDLWNAPIAEKADEIENLRNLWLKHRSRDREFEWFEDKKDGSKRCKCAWEWLEKNHTPMPRRQLPISNYKELLMFFDEAKLRHTEQKAIIQYIKKRWSRKQFDERAADKKQFNVMLSKTVIALLDELTEKHKLTRAQALELLITKEFEVGVYLTDRPKAS